jgi:VanZ family protein
MNNQTRRLRWPAAWLAGAWLLVIAVVFLSLMPVPPSLSPGGSDKIAHFAAYGLMMFGFMQVYETRRSRIAIGAGLALLGITLEFLQGYTGYRSFEVADMAANVTGVVIGWAFAPPRTPNLIAVLERVS